MREHVATVVQRETEKTIQRGDSAHGGSAKIQQVELLVEALPEAQNALHSRLSQVQIRDRHPERRPACTTTGGVVGLPDRRAVFQAEEDRQSSCVTGIDDGLQHLL